MSFSITRSGRALAAVAATARRSASSRLPASVSYTHLDVYKRQLVVDELLGQFGAGVIEQEEQVGEAAGLQLSLIHI